MFVGLLALAGRAKGQAMNPGDAHYYAGAPGNFIGAQPRPGTFYYNDFNRYGYFHFPEGSRVYVPLFGNVDGTEGSKNFSGAAIIGEGRGAILLGGAPLVPGSLILKRNSSFFQVNPGNAADPFLEITQPGPLVMQVMNNSLVGEVANGIGIKFAISTVGYSGIRISFDLGVGIGASANYRIQASADGGATWTFVDETTLTGLKSQQWFNGIPAVTNPQPFFDLSAYPEFDNNPDFILNIYAIPDPSTGVWTSEAGSTSAFPYPGALALDRINLTGTALPSLTPLEQWRQTHFGGAAPTGDAADAADPDGDGLPNLLEYALGGLPLVPDAERAPTLALVGDQLRLAFARRADPALLYQVEASSDLAVANGWSEIWRSTGAQNIAGTVTVSDLVALGDQPRRFLRLRVSIP